MSDQPDEKPINALAALFGLVDRPGAATRIFYALAALCAFLFLLDFTYKKYGHFDFETLPGIYGIYGFVMFTGLILVAKALRVLIKRHEDYYGEKSVDAEDYPRDQLERIEHEY